MELGDPNCIWFKDRQDWQPPIEPGYISHPGFADSTTATEAAFWAKVGLGPGTTTTTTLSMYAVIISGPLWSTLFVPAIPQSEVLAKFFEEIGEKCGEIFRRFSSFNFQGKWPQNISRKILDIFHGAPN